MGNDLVDIKYGEYLHWYYYDRHAVDNNNNNRQGSLPLEEAYCSKRWDLRQFGFIIELCQVNAMVAYNYFVRKHDGDFVNKETFLRMLGRDLILNSDCEMKNDGKMGKLNTRSKTLPPGCNMASTTSRVARAGHELVRISKFHGKWNGISFPQIATEYSKCSFSMRCGTQTRTFCYCYFSLMLCVQFYGEHIASINNIN